MSLTVVEKTSGDVCVLSAAGFIDASTVSVIDDKIEQALLDGKYKVVVDLPGVDFVSSAGWGVFMSSLAKLRDKGGDIKVSGMTERVAKVFVLMEFDKLMESFETENDAVMSFKA